MEPKRILKCRVCLEDFNDEQMFDLFKQKKIAGVHNSPMKLFERVEYCCGVKIRECSEMPSKICFKCYNVTRMWYNFRQMCVNSQVYLESLCSDDGDDGEYLKYLFDDLQTFRSKASHQNSDFYVSAEQTASEREYTSDDDCHDERELTIAEDSPDEIEDVDNSVKERKKEVCDEKDDGVPNSTDTGMKKPKCSQKKSRNFTKRKRRRQASPSTYMCSVCGNVYAKKASFTYHMSLHSDVKPHECELCGKSFRQTCELKNHIRRHTGERPYKCSYCDRCFIDRSEKHRHERVHTNTRPYVCNVCGKSFMYSAILKNHSKLHSGEKEFSCVVCQKAFTLQHQLKAHLQTITHKQREAQFCKTAYDLVYE